jgi:hypothetical protein
MAKLSEALESLTVRLKFYGNWTPRVLDLVLEAACHFFTEANVNHRLK